MTNQTVSYPLQDAILRYLFELPRATHADSWARWKDAVREHTKSFKEERFDDADLKLAITQLWKGHKVELTKTGGTEQYSGNEEDDARFFFQGIFKMAGTADGRGSWEHIEKVPRRGIPVDGDHFRRTDLMHLNPAVLPLLVMKGYGKAAKPPWGGA